MFALLSICSLVRKTTQDKRDYEEQECEISVVSEDLWKANDWWKAKIGGKRMQESSRRNEVSADEWSETKVVRKANVGGKQKWGGTVRKVKHSSVRIENPIPALYRGTEYFSPDFDNDSPNSLTRVRDPFN